MPRLLRSIGMVVAVLVASFATALGAAAPASATSASASWNLSGGDVWQMNAWHCGTYWNACDWTSSTKLLGCNPCLAQNITNKAELQSHGGSMNSITLSKNPSATITWWSDSLGSVVWTNTNAWISDNSGQMKPSWTAFHVSTRSCGWGQVTSSIYVSEKCVYAGAF